MELYSTIISVAISLGSLLIAFGGLLHTLKKDAAKTEASFASLDTSLQFIKDDIKEIKHQQSELDKEIKTNLELANKAMSSSKSAHKRIDGLTK